MSNPYTLHWNVYASFSAATDQRSYVRITVGEKPYDTESVLCTWFDYPLGLGYQSHNFRVTEVQAKVAPHQLMERLQLGLELSRTVVKFRSDVHVGNAVDADDCFWGATKAHASAAFMNRVRQGFTEDHGYADHDLTWHLNGKDA